MWYKSPWGQGREKRRPPHSPEGLRVYGVGEDGVPTFTEYGIECLKQIIADERAAGTAPPKVRSTE
jgi:hypothetical protein